MANIRTRKRVVSLIMPYVEFGNPIGYSIKEDFWGEPYPHKDAIVDYMLNRGNVNVVSAGVDFDCFSGKRMPFYSCEFKSDDMFSWTGKLTYYVKNYNLRLPRAFEEHVLAEMRKAHQE